MASSSSGGRVNARDAVEVLVASLGDESPVVREASFVALNEIVPLNPMLVTDCCSTIARGARKRLWYLANVYLVMATAVRATEKKDVDPARMSNLVKMTLMDVVSSRDAGADWQRAASSLVVAVGSHMPDMIMEEIFQHLTGLNSSPPAVIQILADFASSEASLFIPRLKGVLSRVVPTLGSIRDSQRPIFANAFRCWCQAASQYTREFPSDTFIDDDVLSFLNSVFEFLSKVWVNSRDLKVRMCAVEALGEMVDLVSRPHLKASLPRLIPTMLDLSKRQQEASLLATSSLCNLLNASLLSESGPPLLDFEDLVVILRTLLPVASIDFTSTAKSDYSIGLKTYNEIQHCFLTVGLVYPGDLYDFLLGKCKHKEEQLKIGAIYVLKHLLPRLSESWSSKRSLLVETVKSLLDDQVMSVLRPVAELIAVMASHCYIDSSCGELLVEFLVRYCALPEYASGMATSEVRREIVISMELRTVCEQGLLLISITIPEMEPILWPYLLKLIIPRHYSGAVATVCRCIPELCKQRLSYATSLLPDLRPVNDLPRPQEIFARLMILMHDPLAREQLPSRILTVLACLAPLFSKNLHFWQDEIPKMKAYISDTDDLKQDASHQETWDNMIINFLSETLDAIADNDWTCALGNAFMEQYELYVGDDEHISLLHRCLGMLLQKVESKEYVREKIDRMYDNSNLSVATNRLGLAKGMGLVAASHLDTVLGKLKRILDGVGRSKMKRFLFFFSDRSKEENVDHIHAALALMYGYAATYAPSTVIEARIDALVGTNMLSQLLQVRRPDAKNAVITAIDLLGHAVMTASENGIVFPLKKRNLMLDYIRTLMSEDENDSVYSSKLELLHTQTLALNACTTLVSLEPRLTTELRNNVLKDTLGFFALPAKPSEVIDPLLDSLITLLTAILETSGEDGRSRSEQLLYMLTKLDQYVSSELDHLRKRGCLAVYELLLKFHTICSSGHKQQIPDWSSSKTPRNLASKFLLPTRESLSIGARVIIYIPRCADTNVEVRKISAQILGLLFGITLSLPRPVEPARTEDIEMAYAALGSLEDVIAMLKSDASIDQAEVFNRVLSSICVLLTKDELVASMHGCVPAVCDKIKQSAVASVQAVVEFICKRGKELNETDISRTSQALLSATSHISDKSLLAEVLTAICALADHTSSKVVFAEVISAAEKDITKFDVSRLRDGWPMQEAFYAFSQHQVLSVLFLEYVLSALNDVAVGKDKKEKGENAVFSNDYRSNIFAAQAALLAISAFFRGGGKTVKKTVELCYPSVLCTLLLQLGSCHGLSVGGCRQPLRILLPAFKSFCECVGDFEMGKILARDGDDIDLDRLINLIKDLTTSVSIKRPKEIQPICFILCKELNRDQKFQREAASAALSEFARYSDGFGSLLEQLVESLSAHAADESPIVRQLCLRGLVQIPGLHALHYTTQVLELVVALLEDFDEAVTLTAVECLLTLLESSSSDVVAPVFLNLSTRIRNLQIHLDARIRAGAFSAFGALSKFTVEATHENFSEQVHSNLSRIILHAYDEDLVVRRACKAALKQVMPFLEVDDISELVNSPSFVSDRRADYEDFVRNIVKLLYQYLPARIDAYMAVVIQAFEAPWPIIQANAIVFASSMLPYLDDHRLFSTYITQVFQLLVLKMGQSSDPKVRATRSSALPVLLKAADSHKLHA